MGPAVVSVVIASYNMGRYLGEALDSVLAQDYRPLEVIVVDDGSTDDTASVLARYEGHEALQVVRQANAGQTSAKNRGLAEAVGQYVAFCDADNVWMPGKLTRQVGLIEAQDQVAVVYGDVALIDGAGNLLPTPAVKRYSGRITRPLLFDNFVTFNTTLVRRAAVVEFGGFDPALRMAIDYDLWLRLSTKYEFRYVPETFVKYRVWDGQMSRDLEGRFENAFAMMERFFAAHPEAVSKRDRREAWAHSLVSRARWRDRDGRRGAAWSDVRHALAYRWWDRRAWRTAARFLWHSGGTGRARSRA